MLKRAIKRLRRLKKPPAQPAAPKDHTYYISLTPGESLDHRSFVRAADEAALIEKIRDLRPRATSYKILGIDHVKVVHPVIRKVHPAATQVNSEVTPDYRDAQVAPAREPVKERAAKKTAAPDRPTSAFAPTLLPRPRS